MKIDQFEIYPYSIPFIRAIETSGKKHISRNGVWIKIKSKNNFGWGDAAPLTGFSRENLQEVHYALEGFHQAIIDDNYDIEELFTLIKIHTEDCPSAQFGLETALYDLLSKYSNKALAYYLNDNALNKILLNGIAGIHSPKDRYGIMKVKVGFRNLFDEIEIMKDYTQTFGKETKFRLDANGAFDLTRAIRFCKEMEQFNIDYIEQPIDKGNLQDMAELRYHTEIPIAIDEGLIDKVSAINAISEQSADVFIIKPMVSGGFIECAEIVKLADKEKIRTIITSSLESIIGRASCMHLAAANNINEHCGLSNGFLLNENDPFENCDGSINISNHLGIGINNPNNIYKI